MTTTTTTTTTNTTNTTNTNTTTSTTTSFRPLVEEVFIPVEAFMTDGFLDEQGYNDIESSVAQVDPIFPAEDILVPAEDDPILEMALEASGGEESEVEEQIEQPLSDASPPPVIYRDGQLRLVGGRTENEVRF